MISQNSVVFFLNNVQQTHCKICLAEKQGTFETEKSPTISGSFHKNAASVLHHKICNFAFIQIN